MAGETRECRAFICTTGRSLDAGTRSLVPTWIQSDFRPNPKSETTASQVDPSKSIGTIQGDPSHAMHLLRRYLQYLATLCIQGRNELDMVRA
jgi:hypothetical protein